jgi:two-component system, cell cycle response regulator
MWKEIFSMRITKKIFDDLAIWMIGFGVLVGIVFPFFTRAFGVTSEIAFSWKFIAACIIAGAVVGSVNIILSRVVVANRLKLLTSRMQKVQNILIAAAKGGDLSDCSSEKCHILVDSKDEIGQSAQAFNSLVDALAASISAEKTAQNYTKMLASKLELKSITDKALFQIMEATGSDAGAILIERDGKLISIENSGIKDPEKLTSHPILMEVIKNEARRITSIPEDVTIDGLLVNFKPKEIIIEPLIYNDIPIGVIVLASLSKYNDENINRIAMFSQSLSLALHNAIIHEQMQTLAAIDALTGLLNRRYGMIRLREEYSRVIRSESPLGVVMFDIDHFKKINDTYGHLAGDRVLVHISRLAKNLLREGDILMRYGGEEFCIILPGASAEDSFIMAERIRHAVQESEVTYAAYNIKVTLSAGIASYPEFNIKNEQELLGAADEALYISKESGRNKSTIK